MSQIMQEEAHLILCRIIDTLGNSFTLDDLIQYVAFCRQKRILVETKHMPVAITGTCFELSDVYLIWIRQDCSPKRALLVCIHECIHILTGYMPSNIGELPLYDEFSHNPDSYNYRMTYGVCRNNNYTDLNERVVELIARKVCRHIARPSESKSYFEQKLYE